MRWVLLVLLLALPGGALVSLSPCENWDDVNSSSEEELTCAEEAVKESKQQRVVSLFRPTSPRAERVTKAPFTEARDQDGKPAPDAWLRPERT